MKQEVIAFKKTIAPNTVETIKERVKADGFISSVSIRFYPGAENDLQVKPYIKHKGTHAIEDFFTYPEGTQKFISGDNDYFEYNVSLQVMYDDEIEVWVENKSTNYAYTLSVDVEINYTGVNK